MAVCETNYWRLRKLLLPVFDQLDKNTQVNLLIPLPDPQRECTITLRITEKCPYTSTLEFCASSDSLRTHGDQIIRWGLYPQLSVRIYHDSKNAEVIAFQGQRQFAGAYPYPNPQMRQRDEKFQLNSLLADWLNVCIQRGRVSSLVTGHLSGPG